MTQPLFIRPEAEQDLIEGRDWYDGQRDGLGVAFLTAVDQVFNHIRDRPQSCPAEYRSVRRAALGRFPYVVYHRIVGNIVEVIAVLHGSRSPRQWRSRAQ